MIQLKQIKLLFEFWVYLVVNEPIDCPGHDIKPGFPKRVGAILVSWEAKICIEAKGVGVKYKIFVNEFILDILELKINRKKRS